jgi:3-oxoacyl-[acyl-carrier-protein] synthase-1
VELANVASLVGFGSLQLLADRVQPFDRDRAGIVLGEGIAAMVLSRVEHAPKGVLLSGGGASTDSFRITTSNPDGASIATLQQSVLERAALRPSDVRGIKAHATGSPMNDACEAAALHRVFSTLPPVCALKPYVGHTLGACGVVELALMASSLQRNLLPATHGFESIDPALDVAPAVSALPADDGHYLLDYFGFGGHNTVLLLEKRS